MARGPLRQEDFLDIEKCKRIFKAEKKAALRAAKELYGANFSPQGREEARIVMGNEKFTKCLAEIEGFCHELETKIIGIDIQGDFEPISYHRALNNIGMALDRAQHRFNWDNPLLEYVEEVE